MSRVLFSPHFVQCTYFVCTQELYNPNGKSIIKSHLSISIAHATFTKALSGKVWQKLRAKKDALFMYDLYKEKLMSR